MSIAEEFQAALNSVGYTLERQMECAGLALGVVTNVSDPNELNRVKCVLVENDQNEETDWCYVMAPLGGQGCGQFFFPKVNDLVVLGYLNGDPHRPMVLGAYWNTTVKPPYVIQNGKVYDYIIKTPSGTELHLYDEPGKQKVKHTALRLPCQGKAAHNDNAAAENFFSILKMECIYRRKPAAFSEADEMIGRYIHFYNHERIQPKTGEAPLAPLLRLSKKRSAKGFGGKDSVKENRQGCLSRSIKTLLRTF